MGVEQGAGYAREDGVFACWGEQAAGDLNRDRHGHVSIPYGILSQVGSYAEFDRSKAPKT
jgi:hypothetical protein